MSDIYAYDIEVFMYDSLVVIKTLDNQIVGVWWSVPPGEFPEDSPNGFEGIRPVIQDKVLVGYNNHHYDDLVLCAMMDGEPQTRIKELNDAIIGNDDTKTMAWKRRAASLNTLDTMQQIDVSMPSLKQIEGNMGRSIVETSVPFDIDRPLTDTEKQEILQYCAYDVENTIEVYKRRQKNYFEVKDTLLTMLPERSKLKNPAKLNTTTLSADILLEKPLPKWAEIRLPDAVKNTPDVPGSVWDMWTAANKTNDREIKNKSVVVRKYDCDITFSFGGLHGVATQGKEFHDVMLLDVGSMYPSIVVNLRALGDGTEVYDGMRKERLMIKKSDPVRANALKLILNSVYGNLKNQFSILNNPLASVSVCAYGQLALYDLSRRLWQKGYKLVNLNTDGVAFVDIMNVGTGAMEDAQGEWEEIYNLKLDLDRFVRWIQKDVNNYVAVAPDGHIKVKGGEVNKYHEDKLFSNNNARIIHLAIVDYLLKDVPVSKTVRSHLDDPALYQYILKAGRTYNGVVDDKGNHYNNVNRVFAITTEGTRLYKLRPDGGLVNFPDMPENMMVWNDDVRELPDFAKICDIAHYCNVTEKKLEGWR